MKVFSAFALIQYILRNLKNSPGFLFTCGPLDDLTERESAQVVACSEYGSDPCEETSVSLSLTIV